MGFVIGAITTVKRKVKFDLLSDDGKPPQKADMIVTFRVRNTAESKERGKLLLDYTNEVTRQTVLHNKDPLHEIDFPDADFDADFLREDIIDIEGLLNPDKSEIEFTPDILETILLDRAAKAALVFAWSDLNLRNAAGLKQKNS